MTTDEFGSELPTKTFLTSEEAAAYLNLPSVRALYRRIERGTVPAWCYGRLGRDYRFNRAALDQLQAPQLSPPSERRTALDRLMPGNTRGLQRLRK